MFKVPKKSRLTALKMKAAERQIVLSYASTSNIVQTTIVYDGIQAINATDTVSPKNSHRGHRATALQVQTWK
ncbi:hypothetical protein BOTCAL_0083g00310 [Botryotinia calthae]|uniref:Uncharacterized protein n=1 Tax=Botryotinia calthae TaxID=38488 RepID=A0A4Y8D7Q0_9HELO|nr:hypothetical protein BOTCAL_0083g00310 [Botryotinia calthae]